eukprot:TRINITY_DN13238_c3_g1_i1.p1 TRINITY_DN13238_c3_g1~~TRINITY_DN13238_c3_g1_i1.p1  ORF type:complete len:212 (+),score=69.53 TRINITY_DN13238_c3_g1_i1:527-1162(+)
MVQKRMEWSRELESVTGAAENLVMEKQKSYKTKLLENHCEQEKIYVEFKKETEEMVTNLVKENDQLKCRLQNLLDSVDDPQRVQTAMIEAARRAQTALEDRHQEQMAELKAEHTSRLKGVQDHSLEVMRQLSEETELRVNQIRCKMEGNISTLTSEHATLAASIHSKETAVASAREVLLEMSPPPEQLESFSRILNHLNTALGDGGAVRRV